MRKVHLGAAQDLNNFVLGLEGKIIQLMRGNSFVPLDIASSLGCYDVSLFIAYELKKRTSGVEEITRWDIDRKGLTRADGHSLLGIKLVDGFHYIDGTIWQVFPNEGHIRTKGPYLTKETLKDVLAEDYQGQVQEFKIPEAHLTKESIEGAKFLIRSRRENNWHSKKEH